MSHDHSPHHHPPETDWDGDEPWDTEDERQHEETVPWWERNFSYAPASRLCESELEFLGVEREFDFPVIYPTWTVRATTSGLRIKFGQGEDQIHYVHWRQLWRNDVMDAWEPLLKSVGLSIDLLPATTPRILIRTHVHPLKFVFNASKNVSGRYRTVQLVRSSRTRWDFEEGEEADFFEILRENAE